MTTNVTQGHSLTPEQILTIAHHTANRLWDFGDGQENPGKLRSLTYGIAKDDLIQEACVSIVDAITKAPAVLQKPIAAYAYKAARNGCLNFINRYCVRGKRMRERLANFNNTHRAQVAREFSKDSELDS